MGWVGLADMLVALYRMAVARRWSIKVVWHLTDTAKAKSWSLSYRHYTQKSLPPKDELSLLTFSTELPN